MGKYQPKTKTMAKGLRPLPLQRLTPQASFSQRAIEKMRMMLDEVLANGKTRKDFNKRQLFVADHAFLVVQFHRGEKTVADVYADEESGHRVNFNQEEIAALNFVLLEKKVNRQLEPIFLKLQERAKNKGSSPLLVSGPIV